MSSLLAAEGIKPALGLQQEPVVDGGSGGLAISNQRIDGQESERVAGGERKRLGVEVAELRPVREQEKRNELCMGEDYITEGK